MNARQMCPTSHCGRSLYQFMSRRRFKQKSFGPWHLDSFMARVIISCMQHMLHWSWGTSWKLSLDQIPTHWVIFGISFMAQKKFWLCWSVLAFLGSHFRQAPFWIWKLGRLTPRHFFCGMLYSHCHFWAEVWMTRDYMLGSSDQDQYLCTWTWVNKFSHLKFTRQLEI